MRKVKLLNRSSPTLSSRPHLLVSTLEAKGSNPRSNIQKFNCLMQKFCFLFSCTVSHTFSVYLPDCLIKRSAKNLAAVFRETEACNTFTVCSFKPSQALTTLDFPHLETANEIEVVTLLRDHRSSNIRANTYLLLSHAKLYLFLYGIATLLELQVNLSAHHLYQHTIQKDLYLDLSILCSSC